MDLEADLPRHLTNELEAHVALKLGHVQAVVGPDRHEELQGNQRSDLTLDVGGGHHLVVHHRVEDGHQAVERESLQIGRDGGQCVTFVAFCTME